MNIAQFIADELKISLLQIQSAVTLLDDGATVPFISRYRKEVTGGLSDTDLRNIEERLSYLRELDARRNTILASITEQNKLTPELETAIRATANKAELEDLYLPYKPKRRTKAQIAREAGLEPLATQLLQDPTLSPQDTATAFIDSEKGINTVAEALEGAKQILIEQFSENAVLLAEFRAFIWNNALIKTEVMKDKELVGNKFSDYFTYQEALKKIPSHRALAIFRAQQEEILRIEVHLEEDQTSFCKQRICQTFNIQDKNRPADSWLIEVASWTWRLKFALKLELELLSQLRENAEEEAIKVFANNLKHLLMASPAGSKVTLGLDPGFRTGVKTVVVDGTGKLLHYETIFPHQPRNDWDQSIHKLSEICKKFKVNLVSIGNGTASRETDKLATELQKKLPELNMKTIVVSEAGASVYSASEYAAKEFPDLDVTFRGAVSIARRLQDPLAELVKIEPKAIGVGQYQHDVNQFKLSRTLRAVMEDCVNAVGVDVNTASVPLLTCVAGLNESIAKNIILFRDENGPFKARQQFKKVARLGEKAFEQAAGFLRIVNGDNPLDASAVHPEAYSVVEHILAKQQKKLTDLMGNTQSLRTLRAVDYVNDAFGLPTVTDIIQELEKPGRDPRPEFKTATFKEGIETLADLKTGMVLEGVVTNVANFGAFVDIGVHQDGLVHVSMLGNRFVKDPHEVIKVNDIVKVKVLEIDVLRKRIQLTMRLDETAQPAVKQHVAPTAKQKSFISKSAPMESAFGSALLQAINKK